MIRHIVAWKFQEYAEGAGAMENAAKMKQKLEALTRLAMPGLVSMKVSLNCQKDEMDEAPPVTVYDAVLDSVFADWQSLEAYKEHPEHKKVSAFCKSVRLSRAAVDLIVD